MYDMEEQFKAQIAVLDSMQHAASDAQAPILEQQEANIRDELRCVPKERTSAYEDQKETRPPWRPWTRGSRLKKQS